MEQKIEIEAQRIIASCALIIDSRVLFCKNFWRRIQALCLLLKNALINEVKSGHRLFYDEEHLNHLCDIQVELARALGLQPLLVKREIVNMEIRTFEDVLDVEKELRIVVFRLGNFRLSFSTRILSTLSLSIENDKEEWETESGYEVGEMDYNTELDDSLLVAFQNIVKFQRKRKRNDLTVWTNKRIRTKKSRSANSFLGSLSFCANLYVGKPANYTSLFDFLHTGATPLSYNIKLHIAIGIANGLAAIHKFQLTHLQLASSNILMKDRFNASIACVVGPAMQRGVVDESLTYWKAPETFLEKPTSDEKSNVWAMGVILWELFTMKLPFNGEMDYSLVENQIRNNDLPGDFEGVEEEIACVIRSCWESDPMKRPSSEKLLVDLKNIRKERKTWFNACKEMIARGDLKSLKLITENDEIWKREVTKELLFEAVSSGKPNYFGRVKSNDIIIWLTSQKGLSLQSLDDDGNTLLHCAAQNLASDSFYWLLQEANIDINTLNSNNESVLSIIQTKKDEKGNNLLHIAADSGNLDLVKWLCFNTNIDLLSLNSDGYTPYSLSIFKYPVTTRDWLYEKSFPLHKAVEDGDSSLVKQLICEGKVQVNSTLGPKTALEIALDGGNLEIFKILILEGNADFYQPLAIGGSALHVAARKNQIEFVKFLVFECKAPIEHTIEFCKDTPILSAASQGNIEVVKFLMFDCEAKVDVSDFMATTLLHYMARWGCLELVKHLVENCKLKTFSSDVHGFTPLSFAAKGGHIQVVKYLVLDCNENVHTSNNFGQNALHLASSQGHLDVVKWLVQEGIAEFDSTDCTGSTPLHLAAVAGKLEVVKFLVTEARADVNKTNAMGLTPLYAAIYRNPKQHEVITWLAINGNGDLDLSNTKGLLHIVIASGIIETLRCVVLDCGINNINDTEAWYGNTPLHNAAIKNWVEAVEFLALYCGACVDARNKRGETPLHVAARSGSLEVVKLLIQQCGADQKLVTKNRKTVYRLAKANVKRWLKNPNVD